MLKPRFDWHCDTEGCCVFSGGTEEWDIYMSRCHERPWQPAVVLVHGDGFDYAFDTAEAFAKHLEGVDDMSAAEREALGSALTFVQCFFPTPERYYLNEMRKNDAAV